MTEQPPDPRPPQPDATRTATDTGHPAQAQQPRQAMTLMLRTSRDPLSLVAEVRAAVESIDPEQPISDVRTMGEWVTRSLEGRRTPMLLLALFGGVALVLSAIGIYGVLAFGVTQRAREFGIRQALGADTRTILTLVLTQGLRTAGLGVAIGLAGAFALTRFMSSLLFEIPPTDAVTFAAIPAMLLGVAVLASYIPARRAARIDPVVSLRYE